MKKSQDRNFDTMESAAGALGLSVKAIKRIKAAGCTAFRNGRIHEKELLEYVSAHRAELETPGSTDSLKEQKLSEEIRKLRIANDGREKLVIGREAVAAALAEWARSFSELLEAKLENEWPALVHGMELAEIRAKGKELADQARAGVQELGRKIWDV